MSKGTHKKGNHLPPVRTSPLDFRPGNHVKKLHYHQSDVVGVVTHVLPKTFKVRVQWPYGNETESPEEIYIVSPEFFPATVSLDTAYDSHENRESEKAYGIGLPKKPKVNARVASKVAELYLEKISDLTDKVAACKAASVSDVQAFMKLSGEASDSLLKSVIATVYE